jgi:putative hydrolase of HD superfamily
MKSEMDFQRIVNLFFEIGTGRNMLRTQHQVLPQSNESILDHSFRSVIIGMIIAEMEGADSIKVQKMLIFHDLSELRTGDANFIHKFYRSDRAEEALRDQWEGIFNQQEIIELFKEFNEGETKEAVVAKDADHLDQVLLQCEYMPADSYDLKRWNHHIVKGLRTGSAQQIARFAINTKPMQWLYTFSDSKK